VYSKSAIEEIAKIKSAHLELMVKTQWTSNKQWK
jgi:hypothetical protein